MTDITKRWLHRIIGAFLQGSAHAATAYLATAAAAPLSQSIGVNITVMDWKQLGVIMVGSGLLKLFGVLEKLGNFMQGKPEDGGDTQIITK